MSTMYSILLVVILSPILAICMTNLTDDDDQ